MDSLLKNRFAELAQRAAQRGIYTYTGFLSVAEQALLSAEKKRLNSVPFELFGGCDGCERVMARFGSVDICGYDEPFPITALSITPVAGKFAEALTHRDFLGALMNAGIERSTLGDIAVRNNSAILLCADKIAPFVIDNLLSVKRERVRCEPADASDIGALYTLSPMAIQIASERIDGVIAHVYKLTRSAVAELFDRQLVFINSALCASASKELNAGDVVSVRGYGRFRYDGVTGTTRKGKLNAGVSVYS